MLNPTQLQTLRTVLRTGSFALAADRLSYTPSAVSQQMTALEKASGLQLFERRAHSVRPTSHAQQLADRSAHLLADLDDLQRDVLALARGERGQLRIGGFPTASARLLPTALAGLLAERPGIEVAVDEGEPDVLVARLLSAELDVALVYEYSTVPVSWPAELVRTELLADQLYLLQRPAAGAGPVRLRSFGRAHWIAPLAGSAGALNLDRLAARSGFTPRVSFRSNDYSVVHGLVAAGLGVAVVPGLAVSATAGVTARLLPGTTRRRVLALRRSAARDSLADAALSHLLRVVRDYRPPAADRSS